MIRLVLIFLCALLVGIPTPSSAQKPASPPAAQPAITADQARAALQVLNDPAKRAAFAATLNAIVKAQPATSAATPPTTPPAATAAKSETTVEGLKIPLAPDSLGAQVLLSASDFVSQLGNRATDAMDTVQSLPLLYGWVVMMATNDTARGLLADVVWRLALALAAAAAAEYGLRLAMRRPIRSLEALAPPPRPTDPDESVEQPEPDEDAVARAEAGEIEAPLPRRRAPSAWNLLRRVPLVIARLLLELVPVLGIVLVGHLIAGSALGGHAGSRLIILAVVDSYAACAAMLCLVRMLLSPGTSRLRLFYLRDTTAAYLMYWSRRLILIAVFGYAIGEVGLLLGLSDIAHEALQKGVGLILHLCLAIIVIQKRRAVRRRLRAPAGATGLAASLRNRFANVWHWIALFFLIAGWLVWAIEVPHGYETLLHYFIVTILVLIGARLVLLVLLGVVDRFMRPASQGEGFYPGMYARLGIYHPVVTLALRLTIYLLCVLGLLQLYGLNTFLWLIESALGLRILSASGTLLVTIVLAFAAWEAINGGFQQHLDRLQREAQLAKSARLRTLLPLLRSTVLITIAIIAGLMILGEIGINIAPLLAGAGIIGVAIGFGSQKLVQDLITGIFLLLENAMQVGDNVTVSGLTGVVEALSVRTIRLRAGDGSVHIIPFSSVTSVTNVNRGLGNASVVVSVAHDEDTDRVCDELKAIVAEMRTDADLSAKMLSDLQLWGVDKVDGAQVTIAGQVVCTDSGRWAVQREFNRRMKRRFQELGIRIFNPVQTINLSALVQAPAEKGDDHGHAAAAN
ncbi:mechanosensitive ion channel family protein [Acidisphaera sp. S103]|uniref:mechanosensitive ion channel family protein n=1 Tax=Acidisphaera sp. S103 TaxID=1747223 RepID=UPI00131AB335|nr:mechanosensitive ion channel domain-containing protein [Acidisphaera sp. S103]